MRTAGERAVDVGSSPGDQLDHGGLVGLPLSGEDHTEAFAALSDAHPLLLLPVRLETRFFGAELKVRIYPDQIHLDEHKAGLTADERRLGETFWRHRLKGATEEDRAAATAWLVSRIPARRAAWVARTTRPTIKTDGSLVFPRAKIRSSEDPAVAHALPARWAVVGWVEGTQRFVRFGAAVRAGLGFAPRLQDAVPWSTAEGALPVDDGMAWMVDLELDLAGNRQTLERVPSSQHLVQRA
jgi:hypothetical protein